MIKVLDEKCIGCGACVKDCVLHAMKLENGKPMVNDAMCFRCGHCLAVCTTGAIEMDDCDMNEVVQYDRETFDIDSEKLLNFIKFRRSVRQFASKEVEKEKLKKIIEAGRFTQTGFNMQNVSYVVVQEKFDEVRSLTLSTLNSIGQYILANLSEETLGKKRYADMWIRMYQEFESSGKDSLFFHAPSLILVLSDSDINAALASSNMELMANTLGLGTYFNGFFTMAAEKNPEIKRLLGIEDSQKIVTCLVIGYPDVSYKRTVPRKTPVVSWE
ncbi:MAG TPA: nitroreductase family protein [Lachnospiraceae bacterium]|nr:nitroreductase family protein [Lachnospiraceae bacterium]